MNYLKYETPKYILFKPLTFETLSYGVGVTGDQNAVTVCLFATTSFNSFTFCLSGNDLTCRGLKGTSCTQSELSVHFCVVSFRNLTL